MNSPKRVIWVLGVVIVVLVIGAVIFSKERGDSAVHDSSGIANTAINITGSLPNIASIPLRYSCNGMSLALGDTQSGTDLVVSPSGNVISAVYSADFTGRTTFLPDCKKVIFTDSQAGDPVLMEYDVASQKISSIAIKDNQFPDQLVLALNNGEVHYPLLNFVYAITNTRLLLSFNNPTTGRDAYSNLTSQAVYDLQTGKMTFLSFGGGLPPVVLVPQSNILVMPYQSGSEFPPTHKMQIDLLSGATTTMSLRTPYHFVPSCGVASDGTQLTNAQCDEQQAASLLE